jgi:hypothetical protein
MSVRIVRCLASLLLWAPAALAFEAPDHGGITLRVAQKLGYTDATAQQLKTGNLETDEKAWAVAEKHYGASEVPKIDPKLWKQAKTSSDRNLQGLYGTNFLHFDHESFVNGSKALNVRLQMVLHAIARRDRDEALWVLGSMMHSTQDFFAHSNYVEKYSAAGKNYRTQLEGVSASKLPMSEVSRKENLFSLGAPDPKQKCARGNIPTTGPLTSGYWPDNFPVKDKCHHQDLNKDGNGGFHNAAVGAATLYCYDLLVRVESELKRMYPQNHKDWIKWLKGQSNTTPGQASAGSKAAPHKR